MTQGRHTTLTIVLTLPQRRALHRLKYTHVPLSGPHRRATLVLLRAAGLSISEIAAAVHLSRVHVYKWLRRYMAYGLAGLADRPGRGRKALEVLA